MEFRTGCCWGVYKSYVQECEILTDFLRSMKLLRSILDVNEVTGVWSRMAAMAAQEANLREYSVMQGPPSGGQVAGVGFLLRCWSGRVRGPCMISLTSESQWSLWSAKAWPVGSAHKQRMNTIVFLQLQQIPRGYWSIELFVGVRALPPWDQGHKSGFSWDSGDVLKAAGKLTTLFGLFQQTTWNPRSPQVLWPRCKGSMGRGVGALFRTGFCTLLAYWVF